MVDSRKLSVTASLVLLNMRLGTTTLIITHAAATAAMADRVIHFADGQIREVVKNDHKASPEDISW